MAESSEGPRERDAASYALHLRDELLRRGLRQTVVDDLDAMVPSEAAKVARLILDRGVDELNRADVQRRMVAAKVNAMEQIRRMTNG